MILNYSSELRITLGFIEAVKTCAFLTALGASGPLDKQEITIFRTSDMNGLYSLHAQVKDKNGQSLRAAELRLCKDDQAESYFSLIFTTYVPERSEHGVRVDWSDDPLLQASIGENAGIAAFKFLSTGELPPDQ